MYTPEYKILYILIAATVIVVGVVGYFIYSMLRMHRNYVRMHNLQDKAKIIAIEKERQLIAADLHDDIGPILSATKYKLGEVEPVKDDEKQLLKESIGHIDTIYTRVREISSMLAPSAIGRKGPLFAIEEFMDLYNQTHQLKVNIKPVDCKGLSTERALHVYRMLQEIIHNTIRHAKAKQLNIAGEVFDGELIIHTADDGVGFNRNMMNDFEGLGLRNILIRAEMTGAKVITETAPGEGTRYTIKLSIQDK